MKNNRAQIDIVFIIAVAGFAIALALIVILWISGAILNSPQLQSVIQATPQGNTAYQGATTGISIVGNSYVFLFFGLGFAAVISAFFVGASFIFVVPAIIILIPEMFLTFLFHDIFFAFVQSSTAIASTVSAYPSIIYLFQAYPLVCFILALIVMSVTFMKG